MPVPDLICERCEKVYKSTTWLDRHRLICTAVPRRRNPLTLRAYDCYVHWKRRTGQLRQNTPISFDRFLGTNHFKLFSDLVAWGRRHGVVSVRQYMDWLIDLHLPASKWFDARQLPAYFAAHRGRIDLSDEIQVTVDAVLGWCMETQYPPSKFFSTIPIERTLQMVEEHRLSPWVVFGYDRCVTELLGRFESIQLERLDRIVNVSDWIDRIRSNPESKQIVESQMEEICGL